MLIVATCIIVYRPLYNPLIELNILAKHFSAHIILHVVKSTFIPVLNSKWLWLCFSSFLHFQKWTRSFSPVSPFRHSQSSHMCWCNFPCLWHNNSKQTIVPILFRYYVLFFFVPFFVFIFSVVSVRVRAVSSPSSSLLQTFLLLAAAFPSESGTNARHLP